MRNTNLEVEFYMASPPSLNSVYDQLETKLDGLIVQQNDTVAADDEIRMMLSAHYASIISQIRNTYTRPATRDGYRFNTKWTMRPKDTREDRLSLPRERGLLLDVFVDRQFLRLGLAEKKRRLLVSSRGMWVTEELKIETYEKELRIHETYAMETCC